MGDIGILHAYYRERGGEDISTELERDLLVADGVPVRFGSVRNQDIGLGGCLGLIARGGYHPGRARSLVAATFGDRRPALVHVQNVWPGITPAIHEVLADAEVPTIQHLRNFRPTCINGKHFRRGRVCEDCVGGSPVVRGVLRRCHAGSLIGSALAAATWLSTDRRRIWQRGVSGVIAMSRFGMRMAAEGGIPPERTYCKPNFITDPGRGPRPSRSRELLFVGRLSPEKGCADLIRAWGRIRPGGFTLVIVGDGPERAALETLAADCGAAVHFRGQLDRDATMAAVATSRCLLQPAQWFETFGRTVVEAFATGRGAIASDLGALGELTAGNPEELRPAPTPGAWATALDRVVADDELVDELGVRARADFERCFTPEVNRRLLLGIYRDVLERRSVLLPDFLAQVRPVQPGAHYSDPYRAQPIAA